MAKSQQDTGSTPNGNGAASVSTAARSKRSPKSASEPISKKLGLSDSDLLNILMVDLARAQERFGEVHFLRVAGDEPVMLVLPKTLDACDTCGIIVPRSGDISYCEAHRAKEPVLASA